MSFRNGGPLTRICLAQHCATPSVDSCKLCLCVCMCAQSLSCVRLFATLWTVALHVLLSLGFFRQEHWSGLPCPPPGDLPNPGIEPASHYVPCIAGGFFTTCSMQSGHQWNHLRVQKQTKGYRWHFKSRRKDDELVNKEVGVTEISSPTTVCHMA